MRMLLIVLLTLAAIVFAFRRDWRDFAACALAITGAMCNEAARVGNGGKMPVQGKTEETERHKPLDAACRLRWLCDVFPVGWGWKLSLGDLLLASAVIAAAVSAFD